MIQQIINQNIWWQDRELIRRDPKIADLEGQKFRWRPRVLDEFDLTIAPALYTLRGPRQVGKTTALKILIRDLLRDPATAKEQAMYYSCDNIDTHQQLAELVETYLDHVARLNLSGRTLYLFLDEITSVPDWQRGMKHLADLGRLQNTVVILTGSSARDLRQGAERLPGRRGAIANPDKIMLPMDFSEFVSLVDPELAARCSLQAATPGAGDSGKSRAQGISSLCDASCFNALLALLPHRKPLSMLFDQYLLTGGYITAVNAFFQGGHIPFHLYETYQQWVRGDVARAGRNERTARQIARELILRTGASLGWDTIARKIDLATHKTAAEYIELMEDSFILKTLYQVDLNTGLPAARRMKKVYFLDSFIFWALRGWIESWPDCFDHARRALADPETKARLVEQVTAAALFQTCDRPDWLNSRVYYWRNGGEIDFLVKSDEGLIPIEVKFQTAAGFDDFRPMARLGFKKGILISKDRLDSRDGWIILPVEMFNLKM